MDKASLIALADRVHREAFAECTLAEEVEGVLRQLAGLVGDDCLCTCRVIEKCARCDAIDSATIFGSTRVGLEG